MGSGLARSGRRPLTEIRGPHNEYPLAPGTTHYIDLEDVEFLLNRRTPQAFGGRYVLFYDYATRNDAEQGLMVWRATRVRTRAPHPHCRR